MDDDDWCPECGQDACGCGCCGSGQETEMGDIGPEPASSTDHTEGFPPAAGNEK